MLKSLYFSRVLLFLASLCCTLNALEPHRYSIDELELMAKRKVWNQLVLYLHDVAPADRRLQWESLVERSAIGYLSQLKAGGVSEIEKVAQDLLREYPTLERSRKFIALRDEILLTGFEKCYQSASDIPECTQRLLAMLKEQGMTPHFRTSGAHLALKHSPQSVKELCGILTTKSEVLGDWVKRCEANP